MQMAKAIEQKKKYTNDEGAPLIFETTEKSTNIQDKMDIGISGYSFNQNKFEDDTIFFRDSDI